ncbi:anti-anti-sigma factor [Micromonospora sp. CPCC 205371]|nr:anti-anti-sigma factor [Micromonospora sp. CPCC 205371]
MHNGAIMPTDVRCQVVSWEPYPVASLVGTLDGHSMEAARDALLGCLADQPEAVVVDVSGLTVADPEALSVFTVVAEEAAEWPVARLIFCEPPPRDVAAWRGSGLAVAPTRRDAVARLGAPGPDNRMAADMEPAVGAARRARELVTEACARWDRPELAGSACIVVTELVNNVVAHAMTPMMVSVALRGADMLIAVRDHSRAEPRFVGMVPPTSYGGRGLLLIDTVASRWGSTTLADGKVVWAVLSPEHEPLESEASGPRGTLSRR